MTALFAHELTVAGLDGTEIGPFTLHLDAGQSLALVCADQSMLTALCRGLGGAVPASGGRLFYRNRDISTGRVDQRPAILTWPFGNTEDRRVSGDVGVVICDIAAIVDPADRATAVSNLAAIRDTIGAGVIMTATSLLPPIGAWDAAAVFLAGYLVEHGPREIAFGAARHPYTLASAMGPTDDIERSPAGCPYISACAHADDRCGDAPMTLQIVDIDHASACIRWREMAPID